MMIFKLKFIKKKIKLNFKIFFTKESLNGWNFKERSSCDNTNYFLGGHCKLSN